MRDTQREAGTRGQREKQAPCKKPSAGLNPGSPGSRPEPKADAQLLSHPGVPPISVLNCKYMPFNSIKMSFLCNAVLLHCSIINRGFL